MSSSSRAVSGGDATTLDQEVEKAGRWSLSMAWWALFSAMFWLYVATSSAQLVGTPNTVIAMVLSIITFGAINKVLSAYAARTGFSVAMLSRSMFGRVGSALAALLFAATAIYYAVFEGSIVAVAFQSYFGGNIKWWYLAAVLYAIPLVMGGVQRWLDRLNGYLLPIYVVGLVAVVVASTVKQGYPTGWLDSVTSAGPLPGWATAYLIYMGVWVMMLFTFDYARMAKPEDVKFHGSFTFGWFFYLMTFGVNGLIGIYIITAWDMVGTEAAVVQAFLDAIGPIGLIVIFVSQTRINTANYYLASTNLEAFAERTLNLKLPKLVWVLVAGVIIYLLMLTNVFSYLLHALAWQGVLIVAWVGCALTCIALERRTGVAADPYRLGLITPAMAAWLAASAIGLIIAEQSGSPVLAQLAPVITFVLSVAGFYAATMLSQRDTSDQAIRDPRTTTQV